MAFYVCSTERCVITFRGIKEVFNSEGKVIDVRPKIKAEFRHGSCPEWAQKIAVKELDFFGLPEGRWPEQNLSTFDSEVAQKEHGWTDEERLDLEAWLEERAHFNTFMRVEKAKAPAPWKGYDKLVVRRGTSLQDVVDKIVFLATETEVDRQVIVDYEVENLNRPEVLQAIQILDVIAKDEDVLVGA